MIFLAKEFHRKEQYNAKCNKHCFLTIFLHISLRINFLEVTNLKIHINYRLAHEIILLKIFLHTKIHENNNIVKSRNLLRTRYSTYSMNPDTSFCIDSSLFD